MSFCCAEGRLHGPDGETLGLFLPSTIRTGMWLRLLVEERRWCDANSVARSGEMATLSGDFLSSAYKLTGALPKAPLATWRPNWHFCTNFGYLRKTQYGDTASNFPCTIDVASPTCYLTRQQHQANPGPGKSYLLGGMACRHHQLGPSVYPTTDPSQIH